MLGLQLLLLAWIGYRTAPVSDETAHLAAGLRFLNRGQADLYGVNPPLVKCLAAIPAYLQGITGDWQAYESRHRFPGERPEWTIGIDLVRFFGPAAQWQFTLARWACLPFSLIGAWVCFRWAHELYGAESGLIAACLWCFSPNIMAWSATICPDVAAAAFLVAAHYAFWRWLKRPTWFQAGAAGVLLGVVELTKMTCLVLFPLWPVLWWVSRWKQSPRVALRERMKESCQLGTALVLGVLLINAGYGFRGSLTSLGDYTFGSRLFASQDSVVDGAKGGNRFRQTLAGNWPVPLPRSYLEGIDLQRIDFERGLPSYLLGRWSSHGWWYYYLVGLGVKTPLPTLFLAGLAVWTKLRHRSQDRPIKSPFSSPSASEGACWGDEFLLLSPAFALLIFVSWQTGFSQHFRYVLPAFPFAFIAISCIWAVRRPATPVVRRIAYAALTGATVSSLSVFPHSMSYFNALAGGPLNGDRILLGSNLDWGQDVTLINEWCDRYPERRPVFLLFRNSFSQSLLNRGGSEPELTQAGLRNQVHRLDSLSETEDLPEGWYIASVQRCRDPQDSCSRLLPLTVVDRIGYSLRVFRINPDNQPAAHWP